MSRDRICRKLTLGVGTLAALVAGLPSQASAQLYTPDPFHAFSRNYLPYAYPGGGDPTGQTVASGQPVVVANQFQSIGNPGSFGRFDNMIRGAGRDYVPNAQADKAYLEARDKRQQALAEAMAERDPRKRAEMLRAVELEARKAASNPSLSVRRSASSGSTARRPGPSSVRRPASAATPSTSPPRAARPRTEAVRPTPGAGVTDPDPRDILERSRARGTPLGSPRRFGATPPPG